VNLTPFIPLSFLRRGGRGFLREAKPLFDSLVFPPLFLGEEILERGRSPLPHLHPLPFIIFKGRG